MLLFTATPINRGPHDLLAILELLGPDQLDESSYSALLDFRKPKRLDAKKRAEAIESARDAIRRFTVRRTKRQLDRIARANPDEYRIGDRHARYPRHDAAYYDCRSSAEDDRLADAIYSLACRLRGVARIPHQLEAPRWMDEEAYVVRVVASAKAPGSLPGHELFALLAGSPRGARGRHRRISEGLNLQRASCVVHLNTRRSLVCGAARRRRGPGIS